MTSDNHKKYVAIFMLVVFFLSDYPIVEARFRPLPKINIPYSESEEDSASGDDKVVNKVDAPSTDEEKYIAESRANDVTNYPVSKFGTDLIVAHDGYVNLHVTDVSIVDLLNEVALRMGKKILISSDFPQRVSINIDDMTMEQLLDLLAKDIGINWQIHNGVYIVAPVNQTFSPQFFPVKYANLEKLKKSLDALGLGGRIVLNDYPRGVLVNGAGNDLRNIGQLISQLDVLEPSIKVEFVVVEINKSDETKFGLNWGDISTNYRYSSLKRFNGGYSQSNEIAKSLTASITSILSAGKSSGRILAQPYVVTANAEAARLSTGDEIPIFTKDYNGNPAVNYKKVGIELNVVPRIVNMEEDILSIKSKTTVNIISGQQTQQGLTAPQISSREAEDTLDVRSGEVVVIGGLVKEEDIRTNSGIPFLKDLPLIGKLFQSTSHSKTYTDILIFIKPTIIKEPVVFGIKAEEFDPSQVENKMFHK